MRTRRETVRGWTGYRRGAGIALGVAALLVVGAACSREREKREPTPLDATTVGAVTGEVRFEGEPPKQAVLDVSSAADCAKQHDGPVLAGDVLVSGGKVRNAIVYVKDGLGDRVFAVPDQTAVIDQKGCLFEPRIVAVQAEQTVRFLNSDPLPHNVRGQPKKSSGWNFSLGVKGASRNMTIDEPETFIEIKCDIHPWMKAWVGVFGHPYFAVTDPSGRYALPNLPPGTYTIEAWHERFGTRSASVTVGPKESKAVDFAFGGKG